MKALEKDRNRRYATANGFAAAVLRYLTDEPVVACPPSAAYRLRKFARRNRGWIWSAGRQPDKHKVVARWRVALAGDGATPDQDRAEEAAGRVTASPVRDRMLTALDWWLLADRSAGVRAVLRVADPDPPYREAVRDAYTGQDRGTVSALIGRPEVRTQPARFAVVLGQFPGVPAERKRAVPGGALRPQPGNLGLLMALGQSYPFDSPEGAGERVRWFQAAVAARPGSGASVNSLRIALLDRGDPDGALAAFREAARLEPTSVIPHVNQGNALQAKGDPSGAIAMCREAVLSRVLQTVRA